MKDVGVRGNQIYLKFTQQEGVDAELEFEHVIAATGYKVRLERLTFLSPEVRKRLASQEDVPRLSRNFESALVGLYFVGLASSSSFGPLCRFAYGAKFTSRRL